MTTIEARFRVATPLFCAGADGNRAELRLPSFKGVLRYWWRALAWSRLGGDLVAIKSAEDALFGSAGGGQSRLLMRIDPVEPPREIPIGTVLKTPAPNAKVVGEGARYLGYGVMEAFASRNKGTQEGELTRACLSTPLDFVVRMRARDLDDEQRASLERALIALGTLGGMGAKSRKGYGSLVLRSLLFDGDERWSAPGNAAELRDRIAELHGEHAGSGLPEYTALSSGARHVLLTARTRDPLDMLDHVGRELVRFRSWGRNGKILGGRVDSERLFRTDHDLMKTAAGSRTTHPQRIAFGLPHNCGKPRDKQVGPAGEKLDRRASPMFFHIHTCGAQPVGVVSFLPARYLPADRSGISVGGRDVPQAPEANLYRPIHDFLDRLLDRPREPHHRKEPFEEALEVSA